MMGLGSIPQEMQFLEAPYKSPLDLKSDRS